MDQKKKRIFFLMLFLFFLCVEILIGAFVHDQFIRPYLGDVLVILLLCCFMRILLPSKPVGLGLYMIVVGVVAELLQLMHLDVLLHLEGTPLGVILGSTFDIIDIFCYVVGGLLFFIFERMLAAFRSRRS